MKGPEEWGPILELDSMVMKSREAALKLFTDRKAAYTALWINSFIQVKVD